MVRKTVDLGEEVCAGCHCDTRPLPVSTPMTPSPRGEGGRRPDEGSCPNLREMAVILFGLRVGAEMTPHPAAQGRHPLPTGEGRDFLAPAHARERCCEGGSRTAPTDTRHLKPDTCLGCDQGAEPRPNSSLGGIRLRYPASNSSLPFKKAINIALAMQNANDLEGIIV